MKKFRFLLIVAIVIVSALALCLSAGATDEVTATTYDQVYVGEYTSTDVPANGGSYSGEAYIVFGKVTGGAKAGIIVERYDVADKDCENMLDSKYYDVRDGKIAEDGEFAIALFNVADGYYKTRVVAGDYANPIAEGGNTRFSKGVATYNVKFYKLDGTDEYIEYNVAAGGTVVPPVLEREGWEHTGWTFSSKIDGSFDTGFRDGGWGTTYESAPSNYVVGQDRVYAAVWKYVGTEGDAKVPDTFKLTAKGYNYITADTCDLSEAGSVGVMSFDVLETASAGGSTTNIGTCWAGSPPPYNYYTLSQWALLVDGGPEGSITHFYAGNNVSNITRSTDNIFSAGTIMREGNSVQIVYSPYRDEANPGYLRAYVKKAGASEYSLYAGFENMTAAQAPTNVMPCFANMTTFEAALTNFAIGKDTDGDYATLEAEYGVFASSTATSCPTTDRYVEFDENFVHSSQFVYDVVMANTEQTSPQSAILFSKVEANKMSADNGSYLRLEFTVTESNVDECTTYAPKFGFGMPHTNPMVGNWSGRHGMGAIVGWEADVESGEVLVETDGSGDVDTLVNPNAECDGSYGIGMKDLLTAGTTVRFQVALDTIDDDEHTGYIYVWYKTAEMDDFDIAATVDYMAYNKISQIGGCPSFMSFVQAQETWRLDMTITGVNCATYDANDEITGKASILTGNTFTSAPNSVTQTYPVA